MDQLAPYLPNTPGLLPKWLALTAVISIANTVQSYTSATYAQRVYAGSSPNSPSPVTGLSSRTFGTWTLLSSVIRLYAAYNVKEKLAYELAAWTYAIALFHFATEIFVYKSTRFVTGFTSALVVASVTLTWILTQRSFYLQ